MPEDPMIEQECQNGVFTCLQKRWQLLNLRQDRAQRLQGEQSVEIARDFDLWPSHEVVIECIDNGEADSSQPAGTIGLGLLGEDDAAKTSLMAASANNSDDATVPRSVAAAFEATQNFVRISFNDPFVQVEQNGVDFCYQVSVDGRQTISSLRETISNRLATLHPADDLGSSVPVAHDNAGEGSRGVEVHLRKNERSNMIKDESKPISSLGSSVFRRSRMCGMH